MQTWGARWNVNMDALLQDWITTRHKQYFKVKDAIQAGETLRWEPVVDIEACGDSVRGYWCIGGGSGKSLATWRLTLPEAGRYRVMGKVYKATCMPIMEGSVDGIIYYYTVAFGDQKKEIEVNIDLELSDTEYSSGLLSVNLISRQAKSA